MVFEFQPFVLDGTLTVSSRGFPSRDERFPDARIALYAVAHLNVEPIESAEGLSEVAVRVRPVTPSTKQWCLTEISLSKACSMFTSRAGLSILR
jgi:hypothetical protein